MTKRSQTDPRTGEPTEQFSMVVLELADDRGDPIYDYDMLFLAGKRRPRIGDWVYDPDELPMGFSVDRQRNSRNPNRLTYYLSHTRMMAEADRYGHRLGLRITARPGHGFSYYRPAEFRSFDAGLDVGDLLRPNETVIVQVELKRHVDENVFRLDPATAGRRGFKKQRPSGLDVP